MEHIVIEELRATLCKVADASFEATITYDAVKRILKEEFITNTHRRLLERGHPAATQSQVAFLTGIDTVTIGKTLGSQRIQSLPSHSVGGTVVERWISDPEFQDSETGQPATLPVYGSGPTFQGLVNRVTRGVTPKTVIEPLVENDVVAVVQKHWIKLLNPDWKPSLNKTQLGRFLRKLHAKQ